MYTIGKKKKTRKIVLCHVGFIFCGAIYCQYQNMMCFVAFRSFSLLFLFLFVQETEIELRNHTKNQHSIVIDWADGENVIGQLAIIDPIQLIS